jgi:RimJ/RimL family protein N-acetyltransferase
MTVRKAETGDLAAIMNIYAGARVYMRESGNPNQWKDKYPAQALVERDIQTGASSVCEQNGEIIAVFNFSVAREPTYEKIDGGWLDNELCGVVHRIAKRGGAQGAGAFCLNWCFEQCGNIKIDTHRDNAPMRRLLDKLGFVYCGIIRLENGDERMAFQKKGEAD